MAVIGDASRCQRYGSGNREVCASDDIILLRDVTIQAMMLLLLLYIIERQDLDACRRQHCRHCLFLRHVMSL